MGERLAVRAGWAPLPEPVEILLGEVDTVAHPVTGAPMLQRRDVRRPERMPSLVRFEATESVVAPRAYLVLGEANQAAVRALLDGHGIRSEMRAVAEPRQQFRVDSVQVAGRPSQNVRMQEVFGAWAPTGDDARLASALVVPVDQPLGRLVVALLEPRSDDGVIAWSIVPAAALGGGVLPIQRIP